MPLLPTCSEQLYSPLPPADLLRRLGGYTALVQPTTSTFGGEITRYRPMHRFEGIVTDYYFALRRLAQRGTGWRWNWNFGPASQAAPELEGWVAATATGGSQLQLRYRQPAAAWGLLLAPAGALLKFTSEGGSLWLALVQAATVSTLAGLLAWGAFRYEVAQWRSELAELLQLRPVAPAPA